MDLSREQRLFLNILKEDCRINSIPDAESLGETDWNTLIQLALIQSVVPLFYYKIKHIEPKLQIPNGALKYLRQLYLYNLGRNLVVFNNLSKILKILKENGIEVIILKGAHLVHIVYGDIALRTMSDIDLLVQEKDLSRCKQILLDTGIFNNRLGIQLDIHWDLDLTIAELKIDIGGVWERAHTANITDVEIMVLSPEDLLLHLCIHLPFHHAYNFAGVRTFCDIRETINRFHLNINWDEVVNRAIKWGAANSVYLTMLLAKELLAARVPNDFLASLKPDRNFTEAKQWAIQQIFNPGEATPVLSPYFWKLFIPSALGEKIRLMRKLILPSKEFISQKYPVSCGSFKRYLFYLIRLKDHFSRYARIIWKILVRDEKVMVLLHQERRNITMQEWLSSR